MSHLHSSTRRPSPLKDTDYDHEITLIDHTVTPAPRPQSRSPSTSERQLSPGVSDSSSRRHSDVALRKHITPKRLRQEITRRKYGKYQDHPVGDGDGSYDEEEGPAPEDDGVQQNGEMNGAQQNGDGNGDVDEDAEERGRERNRRTKHHKEPDSAIDILYENQRGGFMCGIPLFSSKALGNLDPSAWTNCALKPSATNITNAQVPDPTWEWAWKEWSINHTDEVDEDGWEYSFAFAKHFSWHGPTWWNSFVRRRAWIRKRVRKHAQYHVQEAHMLNADYFTIHPVQDRSRSRPSTLDGTLNKRHSVAQLAKRDMDDEAVLEDVTDMTSLMMALRLARIDREKMEAVESFIKHGGDELYYLRDRMHEIMGIFIFQASRRLLLSHLLKIFNEATEQQKADVDSEQEPDPAKTRRLDNLEAAVRHADEEVKRLEFWSDVKDMAEKGETKGATDEAQGWGERWAGLDRSGPEDVISKKGAIGTDDCKAGEGNGSMVSSNSKMDKGRGNEE
jgi:hypothetical protein